jgi:predicted transcriptional regulator
MFNNAKIKTLESNIEKLAAIVEEQRRAIEELTARHESLVMQTNDMESKLLDSIDEKFNDLDLESPAQEAIERAIDNATFTVSF